MGHAISLQWRGWLPLISQLLPSTLLHFLPPSSLANSCTLLIDVWRITRNLARSAIATVPGRWRRVLFLVRLKNRRILSFCSLRLSCNAHDSSGIFSSCCSRKRKRLGTSTEFQGWWVWKMTLSGCLIYKAKSGVTHRA